MRPTPAFNRRRRPALLTAAVFSLCAIACADEAPAVAPAPTVAPTTLPVAVAPAGAPSTRPATEEIAALIVQLGDTDSHVRNRASRRLEEIGAPALPSLKAAADSHDLEVQMRSRQVAGVIERPPVPNPPGPSAPSAAPRVQSMRMTSANGSRVIDVNDMGRTIHIEDSPEKIEMTVTGEINGKPVARTYKAKDGEALKQQNAEAFALYDQWSSGLRQVAVPGGNIVLNIQQGGAVGVAANPIFLQVPPAGFLGVTLLPQPVDGGVGVLNVLPGSRAAAMGVQGTDVILKVNDQPTADANALRAELMKHPAGLVLEVRRNGKSITLKEDAPKP